MTECTLCGKETEQEYTRIKARYIKTYSGENKEKRHYFEKLEELKGGLCPDCMEKKKRDDSWFSWTYPVFLLVSLGGLIWGGEKPIVHLLALFLLFMTLVGLVMAVARAVSHNDEVRVNEAMEAYFLDEERGGDGVTITKREFLYRTVKNPERFVLFSPEEWEKLQADGEGRFLES
ncbi:MAG: hypothetical protein PQJ59_06140 [Spirochaetales bacterium]|nr:hypothetical protein [Spirochaetales bacterium]